MVVDAVVSLDELMSLKMIGIKKVQGGALEVGVSVQHYGDMVVDEENFKKATQAVKTFQITL